MKLFEGMSIRLKYKKPDNAKQLNIFELVLAMALQQSCKFPNFEKNRQTTDNIIRHPKPNRLSTQFSIKYLGKLSLNGAIKLVMKVSISLTKVEADNCIHNDETYEITHKQIEWNLFWPSKTNKDKTIKILYKLYIKAIHYLIQKNQCEKTNVLGLRAAKKTKWKPKFFGSEEKTHHKMQRCQFANFFFNRITKVANRKNGKKVKILMATRY